MIGILWALSIAAASGCICLTILLFVAIGIGRQFPRLTLLTIALYCVLAMTAVYELHFDLTHQKSTHYTR